MSQLCSESLQ
jgi:hypothetical protein